MISVVAGAVVSFVISFSLTPVCRTAAIRRGRLDMPNERSSHATPTPRNGGHAIMTAVLATCAVMLSWRAPGIAAAIAGAVALLVLALADERRSLSPTLRLLVHIAVASFVITAGGVGAHVASALLDDKVPFALVVAGCVVWVVGNLNAYNFMDGVNGIASAEAIIAGTTYALLFVRQENTPAATLCIALAAAAAGFIPWNLPSGSIFMGDTGSTAFGYFFAIAALLAAGGASPLAAALPLAPFIADTAITLVRRAAAGEKVWTPHRSHFYQRLNRAGFSHASVTVVFSALAIVGSVATILYDTLSLSGRTVAVALVMAAHIVAFTTIELLFRARAKLDVVA